MACACSTNMSPRRWRVEAALQVDFYQLAGAPPEPVIASIAIGVAMYLSPRTIANHVSNILLKLHATDRTDAAFRARRAGLGESERT